MQTVLPQCNMKKKAAGLCKHVNKKLKDKRVCVYACALYMTVPADAFTGSRGELLLGLNYIYVHGNLRVQNI